MFVQCSADSHALQNAPWYLLPSPCPLHTHRQPHSSDSTSKWSPHYPFALLSSCQQLRTGSGRCASEGVFLVPPCAIPVLDRHGGLHLHNCLSNKRHIVQSHTRKSITDCTLGISSHQQKDGFKDLMIPAHNSMIF